MKKSFRILSVIFILAIGLISCEDEFKVENRPFVVAFSEQFKPYTKVKKEPVKVKLVFSETTIAEGVVTIKVDQKNAVYGKDYKTIPEVSGNNQIQIPIRHNSKEAEFEFENLIYPYDSEDKAVSFEIIKIDYPGQTSIQGYTKTIISFDAALGGLMSPEVGGPTQPFQVYVGLRTIDAKKVKRDSWDLAFYNGKDNRVKINGSIYMAAKSLDVVDIDAVKKNQLEGLLEGKNAVAVGTFNPINTDYIDDPSGDLSKTAIAEIKDNDNDNKVYLINLGFEPGNDIPSSGVNVTGNARGWKKIRILKRDNGYLLQYANLDDTTHKEILISKDNVYNFKFFSFNTNNEVLIEPAKEDWDLNFTVFTNVNEAGSYGYSDFVVNNIYGNVQVYMVKVEGDSSQDLEDAYKNIKVDKNKFSNDQRSIGETWRTVFEGTIYPNIYVIKDSKGNYYKLRFLSMFNEKGQRGYPKFEYKLID